MSKSMIQAISKTQFVDHFFTLMGEIEIGDDFNSDKPSHVKWLHRRITQHFERGVQFYALYSKHKTAMGFIALWLDEALDDVPYLGQYSEVLDLGVLPEYRSQGLGCQLLKFAEHLANSSNHYCIYLSTYAKDHQVISFYKKNHYSIVATMPDVHGPNDEGKVWMRKLLR
ncbi:MAG: GNAT family N-acetyltransferase [Candidatus Cloacimonetes bacterium]|nr:GNAT family N-acetyltransferase [Candidatus Cloacimonadota bacterium]